MFEAVLDTVLLWVSRLLLLAGVVTVGLFFVSVLCLQAVRYAGVAALFVKFCYQENTRVIRPLAARMFSVQTAARPIAAFRSFMGARAR